MAPHWIDDIPRLALGFLPTPLVALDRFSEILGGPRVWMKRDDCTGLATGGNKTRKLEYLLAAAQADSADVVITYGAVQSNHARQTAAACAATGLECHLILARKVPSQHPAYERSGNVQFDRLLGANVHLVDPADAKPRGDALLAELLDNGRVPCVIPVGGSNATGALGYVRCARELLEQCRSGEMRKQMQLSDVVHASSSAGTQSGLVAGFVDEDTVTVHGINVSEPDPEPLEQAVWEIAGEVLAEHQPTATLHRHRIRVDHRFFGTGYGIPTDATLDAIRLLGRTEGVLVDPVYSGKALGGLIHRIRAGEFAGTSDVVFIHTGGGASLPVYDHLL
jgi:L-cysteate sulfo-lyase